MMNTHFRQYISENKFLEGSPRILLAVSGGVDSMVMLHLFVQAGYEVGIAHCNFQLRGAESDGDERFVKNTARKSGLPFFSRRFNTREYARGKKISIQMAARELRYDFFEELCRTQGYNYIATAHHLDDHIETFLFNIVKGSGLAGFTGIPVKSGIIIRPMLFLSRERILEYAKKNKITWREDSSNFSAAYSRNYIRKKIIPGLLRINPNLQQTLKRTIARAEGAEKLLVKFIEKEEKKITRKVGKHLHINIEKIEQWNEPVFLHSLIRGYGFGYIQSCDILKGIEERPGQIFYSESHVLNIDRDNLIISPRDREGKNDEYHVYEKQTLLETENHHRLVFTLEKIPELLKVPPQVALIDADRIKFPLKVRKWKKGDWFIPFGMKGKQKLSDFFINQKIPLNVKKEILVIESGGDIAWVVGYRTDNRFRISGITKKILKIRYSQPD